MTDFLEEPIEIQGELSGPASIIVVGVHGDETCGLEALREILPNLKIRSGAVLFCLANPKSVRIGQRYIDANLNRLFRPESNLSSKEKASYEYTQVENLKELLIKADALLDIHASHTVDSPPFVICEPSGIGIAGYLPVKLVVSGFDRLQPGGLDYFMNSLGKIGICLECGYFKTGEAVRIAKDGILSFLKARGHLDNDLVAGNQTRIEMTEMYVTKSNFVLAKNFSDFESIETGQLIGTDGPDAVRADRKGLILFARNCSHSGEEAFLLGNKNNPT
jgi:predicted deacylase